MLQHVARQRIRNGGVKVPWNHVSALFRFNMIRSECAISIDEQNEKATRQQGSLSFSRENSSNGGKRFRQNFLGKSYEPKKEGVKQFLANKCVYFQ